MNIKLQGVGASNGVAFAKAYLLKAPEFNFDHLVSLGYQKELQTYQSVRTTAVEQLKQIVIKTTQKISAEKAEVFQAHILMIEDADIIDQVNAKLKDGVPLAIAVSDTYDSFSQQFATIDDPYFKERSADLLDVKIRLLSIILGVSLPDLMNITEPCIIVAHDLTPSETAQLNPEFVKGFVTDIGGRTSHAAIMARTLEIPAVLSLKTITDTVKPNQLIGIDGNLGIVEVITTVEQQVVWAKKIKDFELYQQELETYKFIKPITIDGHEVVVEGNIGHHSDLQKVIDNGGVGIGLFRSEFLYMDSAHWPDEETQFQSYKYVLSHIPEHLVIIRTLDIGGDKKLDYYQFPDEMNPFLGYRALRLCLGQTNIFRTQLRALLRASVYGKLGIMFPMVTTVDEFIAAKQITLAIAEELKQEGHVISDNFQIGMMVEVPTAAVLSETFAKHADFFSIGSNDLIQYSMAIDRMSEKVSYLYQPNFPGLLKIIKLAIDGAHSRGKIIGMCGELAGELKSVPLLLGLNLDCFSMSAASIPAVKRLISKLSYQDCQALVKQALELETEKEVNQLVENFLIQKNITI